MIALILRDQDFFKRRAFFIDSPGMIYYLIFVVPGVSKNVLMFKKVPNFIIKLLIKFSF